MSGVNFCVVCERPLDDDGRRRSDAVTCSKRCRTALWRARRRIRRDGGVPFVSVTRDGYGSLTSFEPPASLGESRWSQADDRFHSQLTLHEKAALTREEEAAVAWQKRNPGPLHPLLQQRLLDADAERRRREDEEASHHRPLKVETPLDPSSHGSLARRAMQSRAINKPVDPYAHILRPGHQPGPPRYPGAPEAEMTDSPWGRTTPRSAIGW